MKKIILIVVFLGSFIMNGACQYKKMLVEGNEWYIYYQGLAQANQISTIGTDSLINGVIYKRCVSSGAPNHDLDFLREDSTSRQVFKLQYDSTEVMLYNFNLVVGDTFGDVHQIILDSITTSLISSDFCFYPIPAVLTINNPKVFYFHPLSGSNQVIWIEGIGSTTSFLDHYEANGISPYRLLCHYDSLGNRDYHDNSCREDSTCSGIIVGINKIEKQESNLLLNPNPSSNYLEIHYKKNEAEAELKCFILNLNGQVLQSYSWTNSSEEFHTIPVQDLEVGMYILELQKNGRLIASEKFIKQ